MQILCSGTYGSARVLRNVYNLRRKCAVLAVCSDTTGFTLRTRMKGTTCTFYSPAQ